MQRHLPGKKPIGLMVAILTGCGLVAVSHGAQAQTATPDTQTPSGTTTPAPGVPPGTPTLPTVPNTTTPNTAPNPAGAAVPPMVAAQLPPKPKPITVSGFADLYFQHSFQQQSPGTSLNGRIYSTRNDVPSIGLVWLDVTHAAPPGGLGAKVSLALGDDVDADHAGVNTPGYQGANRYKNLQQLFVNYAAKNGFTARFGKYLSPYGYDTTESYLNPNFSVTLDTFLAPNFVEGLDVSYPIKNPNIVLEGFLVNSLHQEQNSKSPDGILRLNYTSPNGKFNYIPCIGYGTDLNERTILFDNWLTYNLTKNTTLAAEYIYQKNNDVGGGFNSYQDGYGGYFRQQLNPRNAGVFRYSTIDSNSTTTVLSGTAAAPIPAGTVTKYAAYEFTATYEYKVAAPLITRLEFRHDHTNNVAAFPFGTAGNPKSDQDTLTLAALYNF